MSLLFSRADSTVSKEDQPRHNLGLSLLSPEHSVECMSINAVTGSPCLWRRSPRLVSNGYYDVAEDTVISDDEGNVSFSSKATISYKENLVRLFRRKRKSRRSLDSLFDLNQSCQSWLDQTMFGEPLPSSPLAESSWMESASENNNRPTCECTGPPPDSPTLVQKSWQREEVKPVVIDTEACYSHEQFSYSLGGVLDVPFTSLKSVYQRLKRADFAMMKIFFIGLLAICLLTAFSWWLLGGLLVACITITLILTSFFLTKSTLGPPVKLPKAETEDITPRQENE